MYLRRIFEDLVDDVAWPAISRGDMNEGKYAKSGMDEKVLLLKASLPEFLIEHKQWYGIVK